MLKFKLTDLLNIIQQKGDFAEICICLMDSAALNTLASTLLPL